MMKDPLQRLGKGKRKKGKKNMGAEGGRGKKSYCWKRKKTDRITMKVNEITSDEWAATESRGK